MKCRTACLIINPRSGRNLAKLTDLLAVFSAAGWKTDIALKEFGGHTMQLARKAADAGYDLVIGYGGDGTLNQVVNGVMSAAHHRTIVGAIPGGTANVWAHEIGVPDDPVKASLLLVNSDGRKVDLGHVELDSLSRPPENGGRPGKERHASGGRHHFLLMAGLGLDAAIMRRTSTSLKEKIGALAVAFAAVKTLPSNRAFRTEIRSSLAGAAGLLWSGEALQVVIGNTRRYGNIAEVTPEARIDDGVLDVCVITAGDPLTTFGQILSILLHRKPATGPSEYFQGAQFWISVPACVDLQLDGSRVKLADGPTAPERAAPVTYRFDARPHALRMAIPCTYDGALFEAGPGKKQALVTEERRADQDAVGAEAREPGGARHQGPEQINAVLAHGRKVTVVRVGPNPEHEGTSIVAGGTSGKKTGASRPVAVRINHNTTLVRRSGEPLPAGFAAGLVEGGVIVVEGKQSKRGVIRAKRLVVMP